MKTAEKPNRKQAGTPIAITILVWLCRIAVGGVFIFSGWVKAVDPWGTVYKFNDYFSAWGMQMPHELTVVAACVLSATEFTVGISLVTGILKRFTAWTTLLFMAVMTPLTLWIYLANPVSDCGCFGDALIISNGMTLAKNIVLTALAIVLICLNKRVAGLISPKIQWIAIMLSVAYAGAISVFGYIVQPLVDFRPYKVGQTLTDNNSQAGPTFIYQRNGQLRSFTADSLPDDSWEFVERKEPKPDIHSKQFAAIDEYGDDITAELVEESENGLYLLCISNPDAHGLSRSRMANELYDYANANAQSMAAIVATDSIAEWAERVGARYPVFAADATDIESLVRGNAALVYVKNDTVRWKYSLYTLPPDLATAKEGNKSMLNISPVEDKSVLPLMTTIYLIMLGALALMSVLPAIYTRHKATYKSMDKSHGNKF